jgi:2-dehydropantoate 2-reductase
MITGSERHTGDGAGDKLKVCIFGAGAVGGYLAARFGHAGNVTLSVVARGSQKDAILRDGVRLQTPSENITVYPDIVTDNALELPEQDYTFVTVKVGAQPAVARDVRHLVGLAGHAIFAANGVPWWWKYGTAAPAALSLLDPDAELWTELTPERVLGCVVYSANEVISPGIVRHLGNNRWVIGEPDGSLTSRLQSTVEILRHAGIHAEASQDLRTEIWAKLLRNASINSLCALTRLPVDGLAEDAELLKQAEALAQDIVTVAKSQGSDVSLQFSAACEQLRRGGAEAGTPPVRGLRPSMLQDVLASRPLEVEAIVGQVQALAREAGVACPAIDAVLPILRGLNRSIHSK